MAGDTDKDAKKPFNEAAQEPELEIEFKADFDDELNEDGDDHSLRSNADPRLDPPKVKNRGFTPAGTGALNATPRSQLDRRKTTSEIANAEQESDQWQADLRTGNHTFEEEFNGLRVRTWMAGEPSRDNIHCGHIKEMIVTEGEYGAENRLALFKDGNWKQDPEQTPERQAIAEAVNAYDGEYLKQQRDKGTQQTIVKDKGHSR